jgi:glutaredoxin
MKTPKIIAYLKPFCGWSNGVRAILTKYNLQYEDRDIWNDPHQKLEMVQKSGQELSPCVEVDGRMLADISGDELEAYLITENIVKKNEVPASVPTNQACADHGSPITLRQ